jgi:putative oxidoreductase
MFPNGWPGRALLLLRAAAGSILIYDGVAAFAGQSSLEAIARESIAIAAGLLLIAGLWTPITGAVVAILAVWGGASGTYPLRACILLAAVGVALAMLGPGVRSVDARLFGRKRIDIRSN